LSTKEIDNEIEDIALENLTVTLIKVVDEFIDKHPLIEDSNRAVYLALFATSTVRARVEAYSAIRQFSPNFRKEIIKVASMVSVGEQILRHVTSCKREPCKIHESFLSHFPDTCKVVDQVLGENPTAKLGDLGTPLAKAIAASIPTSTP